MPDAIQTFASQPDNGLLNFASGLLSKAVDTAGEVAIIKAQNKNASVPGSVYPTGQKDPAQVVLEQQAEGEVVTKTTTGIPVVMAYMPYIIGIAGLIVLGAIAYRFANK